MADGKVFKEPESAQDAVYTEEHVVHCLVEPEVRQSNKLVRHTSCVEDVEFVDGENEAIDLECEAKNEQGDVEEIVPKQRGKGLRDQDKGRKGLAVVCK